MLYDLFTLWLTLCGVFFAVIYFTEIINVVTLGGLVAGSMLFAAWTVGAVFLAKRLENVSAQRLAVLCLCLGGLSLLCSVMPGYELDGGAAVYIFICAYSYGASYVDALLRRDRG